MEAIHGLSAASCLPQRELRSCAASTSLSSSPSSSHLPLRLGAPRGDLARRACFQVEDAGSRSLSSSCSTKFPFHPLAPSTSAHRHSSRIQSAKKTYSNFDDLLQNTETALCGPCQFMVPILDEVGRVMRDRLRIVKIDSEKYPAIASRYGVQALPTLILFQNGHPIDRLEGALSAPELIKRIEGVLTTTSKAKA